MAFSNHPSTRIVAALLFSLALVSCGGGQGSGERATVSIQVYSFRPSSITVTRGTTVTWSNLDFVTHTVTSGRRGMPENRFDGRTGEKGSFSLKFEQGGIFPYFCRIHEGMVGEVRVT